MQILTWFEMGGYAYYVWSAYGLVFSALIITVLLIKRQRIQIHQKLHNWFKR